MAVTSLKKTMAAWSSLPERGGDAHAVVDPHEAPVHRRDAILDALVAAFADRGAPDAVDLVEDVQSLGGTLTYDGQPLASYEPSVYRDARWNRI